MDDRTIESTLAAVEHELDSGRDPDLRALGFWRAVHAVKRSPDLVARHAERIARIDRTAFRRGALFAFPFAVGLVLLVGGLVVDVVFLALAAGAARPWREILLLVGFAGLLLATHSLAHVLVGTLVGIRFTDWFVIPPMPPGFKIDYASYLRAPPRSRAWMHAAGAITTKVIPFVLIPYALAIGTDMWAVLIIAAVGVVQLITDALFSVKASDWKKFRREMRLARQAN